MPGTCEGERSRWSAPPCSASSRGARPGHNATLAVGYDPSGQLIAAANVCHHSVAEAELVEAGRTVGTWERSSPLEHLETWPLLGQPEGPWAVQGQGLADVERKAHYELSLWSSDHGWRNHLAFSGRDLAHLVPGEVLVQRARQSEPGGSGDDVARDHPHGSAGRRELLGMSRSGTRRPRHSGSG